jgi:tetratricopeptide (TPR) repeat protein
MKYLSKFLLSFLFLIAVASCTNTENEKADLRLKIDSLEIKVLNGTIEMLDNRIPLQLGKMMKDYARLYPQDSVTPVYLFKSAQIEVNTGQSIQAIATLDTLILLQPKHKIVPSVLQFKAFIYDDRLGEYDNAAKVLDELINNYPDAGVDIIENAKAYKASLGKTPEQIILEMELAEKSDSIKK